MTLFFFSPSRTLSLSISLPHYFLTLVLSFSLSHTQVLEVTVATPLSLSPLALVLSLAQHTDSARAVPRTHVLVLQARTVLTNFNIWVCFFTCLNMWKASIVFIMSVCLSDCLFVCLSVKPLKQNLNKTYLLFIIYLLLFIYLFTIFYFVFFIFILGWTGSDCSNRLCPSSVSWFGYPTAIDTAHVAGE